MNLLLLGILAVLLLLLLRIGRYQLKSDNYFFYTSGRSMRPLDIFLAFEKEVFNYRIKNLDEPTKPAFKKWLRRDALLGILVHAIVAISAWLCMQVYTHEGFRLLFFWLVFAQILSYVFHLIADLIMASSVDRGHIVTSIGFYNVIVILKLAIPVIGLFMCTTTAILAWFQFIGEHQLAWASIWFMLPGVLLTGLLFYVFTRKKVEEKKA